MTKNIISYIIIFFFCLDFLHAQEVITGLQSNNAITRTNYKFLNIKGSADTDTLELPFFDDFSDNSIFPNSRNWSDNSVFINNTYSDSQITLGVATFDALDYSGKLYETASSSGFIADQLTSMPLNLDYSPADNIWLSFFYQPGGLSDSPEANDSLTLQFLAPDEQKWYSVWKITGSEDKRFKQVIIRIDNSRFLKSGFRFRFTNYASLSPNLSDPSMVGNCDIWNLDYILVDKNRNALDTIYADVAFRLPVRSLLKNHEAMPWKQFRQIYLQEMGSSIPVYYRNNDNITRNITRDFKIWDVYKNSQAHFFSAGATNISPLSSVDYKANLVYTFNTDNTDSALFRITCSLKTDEFDPKGNDTVVYFQRFSNYFAFDDGSSEGGYGINGLGSRNAMFASRFVSYMQDTLRAIYICFNDSYLNANKRSFDLMVWDDNNGIPGNNIYSAEEVMVEQGDIINGFYRYNIPGGVMVDDIFYIGWRQRTETFLNAGYDVNSTGTGRQYYWLNGDWLQSQVNGSVMIRPVVGDPLKITSINDLNYRDKNLVKIWPNPATDFINLEINELQSSAISFISIISLQGRELMKIPVSDRIDISSLPGGMYIIILSINGRPVGYNRIIKTK